MHLIALGTDTNMVSRGGPELARAAAERCRRLIERDPFPDAAAIVALDREFTGAGLSPGGCADLLAAAFFLQSWENAL